LWIAIPVAVICGLALGALLERFLFRHFYDREHLDQVLLTFALILIFEEVRSLLVGNDFHSVPVPAILDFSVPITGTFSYAAYRLFVIAMCLVVAAVLFYWIERTKMGAIIRAAAEKPEIVDILGIDARRIHLVVFAVGAALAVMAGGLAAPLTSVYPNMGSGLLIISFVVVVVGGLGSVSGAFWAALLIGLIDTLGKAYGSSLVSLPLGQVLAALACYLLVDQSGGEIGVDRHLLAGHGVEVEARRHFGDAAGALGDDHEVHDHQDREHDQADHEIAAHHEVAERLDDVAGGRTALVAVRQDETGRGQVE
ncbi:MAG: branched-chain amino acid ABC transporter permease, partial [Variovorax sp.]|nr:branched-chain amino acid ABC transporter permease [Variovorax sp.]